MCTDIPHLREFMLQNYAILKSKNIYITTFLSLPNLFFSEMKAQWNAENGIILLADNTDCDWGGSTVLEFRFQLESHVCTLAYTVDPMYRYASFNDGATFWEMRR